VGIQINGSMPMTGFLQPFGVNCNNMVVTSLKLGNNGLFGTAAAELRPLTAIDRLDISKIG